jgi:hypothetical protein
MLHCALDQVVPVLEAGGLLLHSLVVEFHALVRRRGRVHTMPVAASQNTRHE